MCYSLKTTEKSAEYNKNSVVFFLKSYLKKDIGPQSTWQMECYKLIKLTKVSFSSNSQKCFME